MTQARFPLGHYVDDFLGAARTDIRWTGGYLLDILCSCLGFLADPSKANDFRWVMDVLGVEAHLVWADKLIRLRVSTDKIRKWLEVLARILADRRLTPEEASKMAGRLSFAVTAAGNKVGRAFIKPFYAQVFAPLPDSHCSGFLLSAVKWWMAYLFARFAATHSSALARPHLICWTDAAGASRLLAAVITSPRGLWFTRCRVPEFIWAQ